MPMSATHVQADLSRVWTIRGKRRRHLHKKEPRHIESLCRDLPQSGLAVQLVAIVKGVVARLLPNTCVQIVIVHEASLGALLRRCSSHVSGHGVVWRYARWSVRR